MQRYVEIVIFVHFVPVQYITSVKNKIKTNPRFLCHVVSSNVQANDKTERPKWNEKLYPKKCISWSVI